MQAQPFRKGGLRPDGPAKSAMMAGRAGDGSNPMDLRRALMKKNPGRADPGVLGGPLAQAIAKRRMADYD